MAYGINTRTTARAAYVYERRNIKDVARRMKVNYTTVQKWKNDARLQGDDWDRARVAASIAGEGAQTVAIKFLEDFMLLQSAAMEQVKADKKMKAQEKVEALSRLADAYNKAMAAWKRSMPQLSEFGVAIEIMQHLARFVQAKFPQHARAVLEVIEPFGEELAKKYG